MLYGILSLCWIPLAGFVSFLIILSAINKSIGVRRAYVKLLLRIFEYGRNSIESASNENLKNPNEKTAEDQNSQVELVNGLDAKESTTGAVLINRDAVLLPQPQELNHDKPNSIKKEEINFDFENCLDYVKAGVEAIIEDDVTSRFQAEELKNWNMLTRTNRHYEFISWKITLIWVVGFAVRYSILMPLRVFVCFVGVVFAVISNAFVALVPYRFLRRPLADLCFKITFRLISSSLSAVITFHNKQYKPTSTGFCVANHTTPFDVAILSTDCTFSLIGQRHGGFLGVLQRALARASPHIWFERGEAKDRHLVAERLKQHVSDPSNPPILIFPEGTCINNTSVMQFKKGSFEVGGVIYPVAIKYDPRFGDAFWNSSKYSMMQYLYMMMTSWAIVCDVWYLPPMYRQEGESAIDFANRVKGVIAKQGGLVDLVWDGQLKRMKPKKEWREIQQIEFANRLKSD
ncbi:PREDICTED: glycerol-3-phosphate acyltransferase 3 isoform X2 [Drosophila arizonae]|uniref:Glycerol-3-phosphate acyltransferase 3 isoform X2 n=1 Tax=Drosophila arizonae TaxID=7263 RepID=A0ABM1PN32_DROAR|nr:PREDICTED: glycerol-3-phosphate acyltransferase 3 isoform X2 [Drosophila arizonae]